MDTFWIIFLIFLGVAVAIAVFAVWSEQKRTQAWQRVAGELGIEYQGDANHVLDQYGQMKIFQRGRGRRVTNAIAGDAGDVRITLGDFRYRTGGSKNKRTYHRTVCVLESALLSVPNCYLRPEMMLFDALGSAFGGQDIDFADDPDFSKAYVLQGEDEAAVRELFDAGVRSWFVARKSSRFHFEARGGTLVFHTGRRRPAEEARELMAQALEIMKLLGSKRG